MTTAKESLVEQLRETIEACSRDEDLPFWGEVFVLLHELKKVPAAQMPLYELEPAGEVSYDRARRMFIVHFPDRDDIHMKDAELADAIVKKGLYRPKPRWEPGRLDEASEALKDLNSQGGCL